jgi:hypothetical protein
MNSLSNHSWFAHTQKPNCSCQPVIEIQEEDSGQLAWVIRHRTRAEREQKRDAA